MLEIVTASDPRVNERGSRGWEPATAIVESVRAILADVRQRGDAALVEYARSWDSERFTRQMLRVPVPSLDEVRRSVPAAVGSALELAKQRVAAFHSKQVREDISYEDPDGTCYAWIARPLDSVAAYIPGGSAPLPSTAIMTVVPAKLAGVARVALLTPPQHDGSIHPAILFAASLCRADEIYAVGGAQAVAAAAYGTETIPAVDKIVGPGNVWVTEAKRQVYGVCGIDGLAGPSEVLVALDDGADAEDVAAELLAQAEHDPHARVAAISESLLALERVRACIERSDVGALGRDGIIAEALEHALLIQAGSFEELCATIDAFAPEHLALRVGDPWAIVERVHHAGAIFIGGATPVACGDYLAGTNHVLPTAGSGRFASGLRVMDFLRTFSVLENSEERMRRDAEPIASLAEYEGLTQHARTARMRLGNLGSVES
jgi:histidinol dehydrogenase